MEADTDPGGRACGGARSETDWPLAARQIPTPRALPASLLPERGLGKQPCAAHTKGPHRIVSSPPPGAGVSTGAGC